MPRKKKKITTALARAARAGVKEAKAKYAGVETKAAARRRIKGEGAGVPRYQGKKTKPKPKPKPPKSIQERATGWIGLGPLLEALKPKKKKEE